MLERRKTKKIKVGDVFIGGDADISVQTMTNTSTEDIDATITQIQEATAAQADIVRVSCNTKEASSVALKEIIRNSEIPVIADIHFNYKRAIESIENGAHCIRINPGNIDNHGIREIIECTSSNDVSLRIGINSGSLEREILEKYPEPDADALVESALLNIRKLEDLNFTNFKISVKSSDVNTCIKAYRKLSDLTDYPLHVGITEAGPVFSGTIKSAIGIGALLVDGIGDTIRVSLSTKDIREEVRVGRQILKSLGLLKNSVNIVSCPMCARTLIDVVSISKKLEEITEKMQKNLRISVLGCVVNGIGEAHESDIGIFGFKKGIVKIYVKNEEIATLDEEYVVNFVVEKLEIV